MLNNSDLPHNVWGEALLTANFVLIKILFKSSNKSPCELWKKRILLYKMIKVWGCLSKVLFPLPKRTKLGPKTIDYVFISFTNASIAYKFLVFKSNVYGIHINTIVKSIDAKFFENIFPNKKKN